MNIQYEHFLGFLFSLSSANKSFKIAGEDLKVYIKDLNRNEFVEIVKEKNWSQAFILFYCMIILFSLF